MEEKNPNKAAIALKYNQDKNKAPEILAAGKGAHAESIIEMAQKSGIPLQHSGPSTQGLTAIDMKTEIPQQFYQLVAEILWFVHKLDETWLERKKNKTL